MKASMYGLQVPLCQVATNSDMNSVQVAPCISGALGGETELFCN